MTIGNPFGDHEGYLKIINNTDHKGMFGFAMLDNPLNFMEPSDSDKRCDYYTTKALRGFHRFADGVCNCGLTTPPNRLTGGHFGIDELICLFPVVDAGPVGIICYFEFHSDEDEEFYLTQRGNTLTRTLQEQFRFLIEWEYAHHHLDNNEEIAICAAGMLEVLDLPITIREWILDFVPNEKVNRFLEGRTDALQRADTTNIPDLTDEFKEWLLNRFKQAKSFGEHG